MTEQPAIVTCWGCDKPFQRCHTLAVVGTDLRICDTCDRAIDRASGFKLGLAFKHYFQTGIAYSERDK